MAADNEDIENNGEEGESPFNQTFADALNEEKKTDSSKKEPEFKAGFDNLQTSRPASGENPGAGNSSDGVEPLPNLAKASPEEISEDPFDQAMDLVKKGESGTLVDDFNPYDKEFDGNLESLLNIKFDLILEIGRARMKISDILLLGQGSVIELNKLVGDELNILVNDKWIARGEIVICRERFGTRITHILSQEERLKKLGTFF